MSPHQQLYCPHQAAHLSLHGHVPAGKYVMEGGKVVGDGAVTVNGRRQPREKHGEVGGSARNTPCCVCPLLWLSKLARWCVHATLPCCLSPAQHHRAVLVQVLIKFFMLPADFKHERAFFNGFVHGSFVPGMPAPLHGFP